MLSIRRRQTHSQQAPLELLVRAQGVPWGPYRKIYQRRVAGVDRPLQVMKGFVRISCFRIKDRRLYRGERLGPAGNLFQLELHQTGTAFGSMDAQPIKLLARRADSEQLISTLGTRGFRRSFGGLCDSFDEAIARARHGLDVTTDSIAVAKDLAQGRDVHRENAFFDERLGPHSFQQFALGDQLSGVANHVLQQIISFGSQGDGLARSQKAALPNPQRERSKLADFPTTLKRILAKSSGQHRPVVPFWRENAGKEDDMQDPFVRTWKLNPSPKLTRITGHLAGR